MTSLRNSSALTPQRASAHTAPRALRSDFLLLAARFFPAAIFWQSGRTKMNGWQLDENAVALFAEEYRLPLLDPSLAAHLAALAEHLLPLLLVLGLGSRLAAAGLLAMTAVIQTFVYPDAWPTHGVWAVALLLTLTQGAGRMSLDALLARAGVSVWRSR